MFTEIDSSLANKISLKKKTLQKIEILENIFLYQPHPKELNEKSAVRIFLGKHLIFRKFTTYF